MKIRVETLFDCTATGITGHFRSSDIPCQDKSGQWIRNQADWNRSRNQQRNWETLQQITSLRCQVDNYSKPLKVNDRWQFDFEVERSGIFGDDLEELTLDCNGIPMICGLGQTMNTQNHIMTQGKDQNIWFESINTDYD